MPAFIARTAGFVFAIILWVCFVLKLIADWIGRTTVVDDFNQLVERMPIIVGWIVATPWWVPGGLAGVLTAFLMWAGWPAAQTNSRWVSRKEKYSDLGIRALQIAHQIDHFQSIGKWVGHGGALGSEVYAAMVRFHDMGFAIPTVTEGGDQDERLALAFRYLSVMGALLRDGSVAEAQIAARKLSSESGKPDVARTDGV